MSTNSKNAQPDLAKWISLADAARLRGVSRQAMSKLVKIGRFQTINAGGRQLVHKEEVVAYKTMTPGRRPRKSESD